jgi:hypothetical protein
VNFYFDVYLQEFAKANISKYIKELERYNASIERRPGNGGTRLLFVGGPASSGVRKPV